MQWFGTPVPQNRFLGQVDQDDPTNLPMGLASRCRNFDFTRDSGGPTCATVRAGLSTAMQCVDPACPVTGLVGFVYTPESATDPDFQLPIAFQPTQGSQYESPVGSGHMVKFPIGNFTEPQGNSQAAVHSISASAGNQVFTAYSDLKKALSGLATINPKTKTVNPYGIKPFGWNWQPATYVLEGEVCTPAAPLTGNGHTYQALNSGWTSLTAAGQPIWPLTDGGTVIEANVGAGNTPVTWQEHTMVIANCLPPPPAATLTLNAAVGAIPAAQDVYVLLTLLNPLGETLASAAAMITTGGSATNTVNVQTPTLAQLRLWIQSLPVQYKPTQINIYTFIQATGLQAPAQSAYELAATVALGTNYPLTAAGSGAAPPTVCSARVTPGQLPTPDVAPALDRNPAAGTFAAGRDVYVIQTYLNDLGETPAGPASSILNTNANDAVVVTLAEPLDNNNNALYTMTQIGIYEADVPTGAPAPPPSAFALVGYFGLVGTTTITATATGAPAPISNTTGSGGNIAADTSTGGPNGTQGYRYASVLFINEIETFSGFTQASVVQTVIDEDGWALGTFLVPTGPAYIVGRAVIFTVADAAQAGPFFWNGVVNLLAPEQNVVYPGTVLSDGVQQSATIILDNMTTQAWFNFTDGFLTADNPADAQLQVVAPPWGVRIDYLPTIDRVVVVGVPGYKSTPWISNQEDYESYNGDTSPVPISANGQTCYGVTDKYKGIIFALMSDAGFVIDTSTGDPSSWDVVRRWGSNVPGEGVGPCGFRAWAACGKYIIFAHTSGVYRYDQDDPDLMTKEVPKEWARINWAAGQTINITIDEDTHTARINVPVDGSMVPNQECCLSYIEGWQNPIHFSTFAGKEISMDAARRWSFNDVSSFVTLRMDRQLPQDGNAYLDGPNWNTLPDSSFQLKQLLFASSGPDGTVQARIPGNFYDNLAGIDAQYETMSSGLMQALCKPEGFNLNIAGYGTVNWAFLASRARVDDEGGEPENIIEGVEVTGDPFAVVPNQIGGITQKCAGDADICEYWRLRFTNGKRPGNWFSLKSMTPFIIPVTPGRDPGDTR